MAKVNVTAAAKLAGIGRQQLYRGYITTGKISVDRDSQNRPVIDTAEILRVFGELKATPKETPEEQKETLENMTGYSAIETHLAAKDEIIASLRAQIVEAADREIWLRQQLERVQALLTDQRQHHPWWKFW